MAKVTERGMKLVKLSEWHSRAKFDIYHVYGVKENCNVKAFVPRWPAIRTTLIITLTHFSCERINR